MSSSVRISIYDGEEAWEYTKERSYREPEPIGDLLIALDTAYKRARAYLEARKDDRRFDGR